jgi:hypothetical protein
VITTDGQQTCFGHAVKLLFAKEIPHKTTSRSERGRSKIKYHKYFLENKQQPSVGSFCSSAVPLISTLLLHPTDPKLNSSANICANQQSVDNGNDSASLFLVRFEDIIISRTRDEL